MRSIAVVMSLAILLCGCEGNRMGAREKGALGGGALGAGLGAIVGNQVGNTGAGIAIGSAFGLLGGALAGNQIDVADAEAREREGRLDEQQRQLEENRRMIEDLRSRGADARATDRGVVVNLPDVLFDFDRATLAPSAESTVREIATVVRDVGDRSIAIEGHTDSIGSVGYNQSLSEGRAKSVANDLVRNGVPRKRLAVRGMGESDPIASNATESGRARNRRVEVVIQNR
jgi:outer membrane protein OmpA-like peptidoglycan-associated protein